MRFHRLAATVVVTCMALAVGGGIATAQDDEPLEKPETTLTSNLPSAGFGERVIVSGTNWPSNSIVQVQICGNEGRNATSDCDQRTSVQTGVDLQGSFAAVLLVGNPPVPCPCVFRARSQSTGEAQTLEFTLVGAAVNPDEPTAIVLPERRLDVTEARIEGSGPWTALFGAPPDRTLVLTVANIGAVAVEDPSIVLALGKGENPTGFVEPPEIGRLEPGESTTVRVDLDLPAFAIGTYAVEGSMPGFVAPVEFRAETSHVPWLLLIIPTLILLQVAAVTIRNRIRDRVYDDAEADRAAVYRPPVPGPVPAAGAGLPPLVLAAAAGTEVTDTTAEDEPPVADQPDEPAAVIDLTEGAEDVEPADEPVAEPVDLEAIIAEELSSAFERADDIHDEAMNNGEWRRTIIDLSDAAAERVVERAGLTNGESTLLYEQIAGEMLDVFGLDRTTPA